jgi:hypothetical protein
MEKDLCAMAPTWPTPKHFFQELNGFDGNEKIASGDDVFLLQKAVAQFPYKVHYLKSKNNIVYRSFERWKSLFYQRVRGLLNNSYQSSFGKLLGLVVLMGNLCWLLVVGSGLALRQLKL